MNYFQHLLKKCSPEAIYTATNKAHANADTLLEAYFSSTTYKDSSDLKNKRLIRLIKKAIDTEIKNKDWNKDTLSVINRLRNNSDDMEAIDDIFDVLSDYLWLCASRLYSRETAPRRKPLLIQDTKLEISESTIYIENLKDRLSDAFYKLDCIDKAEHLSILETLFPILISNPDIIDYMPGHMEHGERKGLKEYYEGFIWEKEPLYYALMATNIYKYELQRKYE